MCPVRDRRAVPGSLVYFSPPARIRWSWHSWWLKPHEKGEGTPRFARRTVPITSPMNRISFLSHSSNAALYRRDPSFFYRCENLCAALQVPPTQLGSCTARTTKSAIAAWASVAIIRLSTVAKSSREHRTSRPHRGSSASASWPSMPPRKSKAPGDHSRKGRLSED